jgi:hypothetical protein
MEFHQLNPEICASSPASNFPFRKVKIFFPLVCRFVDVGTQSLDVHLGSFALPFRLPYARIYLTDSGSLA